MLINDSFSLQNGALSLSGFDKSSLPPIPTVSQKQRKGRRRLHSSVADEYEDGFSKVHQDDEYSTFDRVSLFKLCIDLLFSIVVYPSLDASDDESVDRESAKKKPGRCGRTRLDSGDESWNPRARVGPVVPKTDRPTREGAKRPAIERVLEAAAQRRAHEPVIKDNFFDYVLYTKLY